MKTNSRPVLTIASVLRILIGWHFLYEGIVKLMSPNWTSRGYLEGSYGFLSGFYHALCGSPSLLSAIDFMNEWGLILIGLGLILGAFTRLATASGILLLLLYYFAYPPFGNGIGNVTEGNYWIVNKTLLEALTLALLFFQPTGTFWGLDYYLERKFRRTEKITNDLPSPSDEVRRVFLRNMITLPVLGGLLYSAFRDHRWSKPDAFSGATIKLNAKGLEEVKNQLPTGKIKNLGISRLILGCNLMGGFAHSRDLQYVPSLFRAYNTESKILQTLYLADKAGINTTFMVNPFYPLLNEYKKRHSSKMKTICQAKSSAADMFTEIKKAIDFGADAIYIQGSAADAYVRDGKAEKLGKLVEFIRKQNLPAGIGAHSIQVVMASEKLGLNPDFYVKTFHHDRYWSAHPRENRREFEIDVHYSENHNEFHDNMFDIFPEQTISVMSEVKKPWIAFKVLAGGAIKPEDGFRFAFENGADFICVGMFDFQVVDNVNLTADLLKDVKNRKRAWLG